MRASVLVGAALVVAVAAARTPAEPPRFFFEGSGRLVLRHGHFDTTLNVRYRHADGTYDPDALAQIRHFFRSREDGREASISLRLIELLAYIQDHYHPRQMILLSGFRSPQFNADLRNAGGQVAQASLHTEGLAADIAFTGIDLRRLWQQLRGLHAGGAGYYRSGKFIHVDTGPPRFWEETTSRVSENLAADNARIFLRTDYDRYGHMAGAILSLHSITAFPVRIAAAAAVIGSDGGSALTVEPLDGDAVESSSGCFAITRPLPAYQFRVIRAANTAGDERDARSHVVLSTCEPRIGKTAAAFESNPIELVNR
jgi:uncharacterized protein YcbK (DUF882 family)